MGRKRLFDYDKILTLLGQGKSISAICDELLCEPRTVYYAARTHKVALPPLTPKHLALLPRLTELSSEGKSLRQIAEILGVTRGVIAGYRHRAKLPKRELPPNFRKN